MPRDGRSRTDMLCNTLMQCVEEMSVLVTHLREGGVEFNIREKELVRMALFPAVREGQQSMLAAWFLNDRYAVTALAADLDELMNIGR